MNKLEAMRSPEAENPQTSSRLGELALRCAGCPFKRLCDEAPAPRCESKMEVKIETKKQLKEALMDDTTSSIYLAADGYITQKDKHLSDLARQAKELAIKNDQKKPKQTPPPIPNPPPKEPNRQISTPTREPLLYRIEKFITKAIS